MNMIFSVILMEGYAFNDKESDIRQALRTFFRLTEEESLFVQTIDGYYEDSTWFHTMLNNCTCAEEIIEAYADAAYDYLWNQDYLRYGNGMTYVGQLISAINQFDDSGYESVKNRIVGFDNFSAEVKEFLSAMFPQIVKNPTELLLIADWS